MEEKTGIEYRIKSQIFEISLIDVITYLINFNHTPFLFDTLYNFFQKVNHISEMEKVEFLFKIIQNKNIFNEFVEEIKITNNAKFIYEKYEDRAEKYCSENYIIC